MEGDKGNKVERRKKKLVARAKRIECSYEKREALNEN